MPGSRTSLVLIILLGAEAALACGPDFPVELLARREASLLELGSGVFLEEAARLVTAPEPAFVVAQWTEPDGARSGGGDRERRAYEEGARLYNEGDHAGAAAAFAAVLALPEAERRNRSTWAAYMLGRLGGIEDGIARYREVRVLARAGLDDELGLAVSSLGQEGRLHLHAGRVGVAVALYAEQAARGSADGAVSLLQVARDQVRAGAEAELLEDELGQRLLSLYLHTRGHELDEPTRARVWSSVRAADRVAGADRLAAAAYRAGRWEEARDFAGRDPDARLSRWVLAKLALRDGDRAEADRLLGLVAAEPGCDAERAHGERAVLTLAQGKPVDAAEHAWRARAIHPDVYYIAERVLTVDELVAFVRAHPGDKELSAVLARRLMRAGRFAEAEPWFVDDEHRSRARALADAMSASTRGDRFERAAALFEASRVTRRHGLEILGTAHAPDWALYGGGIDPGHWTKGDPPGAWVTDDERSRVDRSAPEASDRYHYRVVASRLAERAADHLPPRSQAFAASLCHAAKYVMNRDTDRVQSLWSRYVREGPMVDFAGTFGQSCPPPEIERSRELLKGASHRLPLGFLAVGLGFGLLGLVGASLRRRLRTVR
jgi:hypothetical protein